MSNNHRCPIGRINRCANHRVLRRLNYGPLRRAARPRWSRLPVLALWERLETRMPSMDLAWARQASPLLTRWWRHLRKCADVGADLVGKVEAGIPEDDPETLA